MTTSETTEEPTPKRRSGNYPSSVWSDSYIQSLKSDFPDEDVVRIEKLKEYIRPLIVEKKEILENLEFVDTLQQLGLGYHFEVEIVNVLANIHKSVQAVSMVMKGDLYTKALLFRLLRERGFTVSQDLFNSFKDEDGNFNVDLLDDTRGLLSLHKASHYAIKGEKTLDAAKDFTIMHLNNLIKGDHETLENSIVDQIIYSLDLPLNWRLNRAHYRWYIDMYEKEESKNPNLVELAKLDFNMVQNMHRKEIKELSRWWSDLNLCAGELSFARNRLLENYLASAGYISEPSLSRCRKATTKSNCLMVVTDDIYDIYGTMDELELFTAAVERWEVTAIEQLPEYMKIHFLAIFNMVNLVAYEILRDKGVNILPYLKRQWTGLTKAFMVEAKWYHEGYAPTFEEYLENARVTASIELALTVIYCVNEDVTTEALEGFKSYHANKMLPPSMIVRLCNDLGTSSNEIKRGDVPKSVQCYMIDKGVTESVAKKHMRDLINLNWKILNGEGFPTTTLEKLLRCAAVNICRTAHLFYQHGDGFGSKPNRETKDHIISLFIEPILL